LNQSLCDVAGQRVFDLAYWLLVFTFAGWQEAVCQVQPITRLSEQRQKVKKNRIAGFTLVEIMIAVSIIGVLASIAIPNFVKARTSSQQNACINNLRLIDSSKQQWALEQRKQSSATPEDTDLQPYLGRGATGELPTCPVDPQNTFDTSYTVNVVSTPPTCNIVSATHVLPDSDSDVSGSSSLSAQPTHLPNHPTSL
jgi:prepilin-type N-terminal cleavage/methylation domain-containing protein